MVDAVLAGTLTHAGRTCAIYYTPPTHGKPGPGTLTAKAPGLKPLTMSRSVGGDHREQRIRAWLEGK